MGNGKQSREQRGVEQESLPFLPFLRLNCTERLFLSCSYRVAGPALSPLNVLFHGILAITVKGV